MNRSPSDSETEEYTETAAECQHKFAQIPPVYRYDPENRGFLIRYVDAQIEENAYDLQANLYLLHQFQYEPEVVEMVVLQKILVKCMMRLPDTDFVGCKALMDNRYLEKPEMEPIFKLTQYLESCQFETFWKEFKPQVVFNATGFEDAIRNFICHVVAQSHRKIDLKVMKSMLGNLSDAAMGQMISSRGWKVEGNWVLIPYNQEQPAKPIEQHSTVSKVFPVIANFVS